MNGVQSGTILVEFPRRAGGEQVSLTPVDLVAKSEAALDRTTEAIRSMARRVTSSLDGLEVRPKSIEVEFGLKFDAEAGVLVSKAGVEASVNVTLLWEPDGK